MQKYLFGKAIESSTSGVVNSQAKSGCLNQLQISRCLSGGIKQRMCLSDQETDASIGSGTDIIDFIRML
jgi:hypothetical protein